MNTDSFTAYCGLKIDLNYEVKPSSGVHVIFSSGYSILGFDEPIQVALRSLFSKLGIGWIQYTFPERTVGNPVEDLYLSTGLLALQDVQRWASARFSSRLALFGISFGANIAIEYSLTNSTEFMVLVNPVFNYREFRERQLGNEAFQEWERTGITQITYPHRSFPLSFRFIKEADAQNLEVRAKTIPCPVYAFQAMQDSFISTSHVERLAATNPRWNAFLVPNADHAFDKQGAITFCLNVIERILASQSDNPTSS